MTKPTIIYRRYYETFDTPGGVKNRMIWVTDIGNLTTQQYAEAIGISESNLIQRWRYHGNNIEKLHADNWEREMCDGNAEWQRLCLSSRRTARRRNEAIKRIVVGTWEARL